MRFYRGYVDGHLPYAGAITDQPNVVVEALDEIATAKGVLDQEDFEKNNSGNNTSDNDGGWKSIKG